MTNYLDIKNISSGYEKVVKQDLKFRTGNFVWRVIFNIPLNPATVNNENLTVYNTVNKPLKTKITYNSDTHSIEIEPLEPYSQGETYTLHINKLVESKGGQRLKQEIDVAFQI